MKRESCRETYLMKMPSRQVLILNLKIFEKRMVTLNLARLTDGVKYVRMIAMISKIAGLPNSATNAKRKDILLGYVEQKVFNNPRRPQNQHNYLLKPTSYNRGKTQKPSSMLVTLQVKKKAMYGI
jgi:hypothetical protein